MANLEKQDLGDIKKSAIEEDHLASFNRKQCGKRILRYVSFKWLNDETRGIFKRHVIPTKESQQKANL